MRRPRAVFLDFDDTLNDQFELNRQYVRAIGSILACQYGGQAHRWAECAAQMLVRLEDDYIVRFKRHPLRGYRSWLAEARVQAAELLFACMESRPPAEAASVSLATQAAALHRCSATFPGAKCALAELRQREYSVHIASGQESEYISAALEGAGMEHLAGLRFGPDLVDCAKEGPEYYARIFAEAGVRPEDAVVLDDDPAALAWALATGATVVQARLSIERRRPVRREVYAVIERLDRLPNLMAALEEG